MIKRNYISYRCSQKTMEHVLPMKCHTRDKIRYAIEEERDGMRRCIYTLPISFIFETDVFGGDGICNYTIDDNSIRAQRPIFQ